MSKTSVLVAGRSPPLCDVIKGMLEGQPDLDVRVHMTAEDRPDPLSGQVSPPDVLIMCLSSHWEDELRALGAMSGTRPPLIAIGPSSDSTIMRRAMQIGARDLFSPPVAEADLLQSLRQIAQERGAKETAQRGEIIAVINAKGGSGASTLAGNLAHILAMQHNRSVCLMDLDLQFGALALAFDMQLTNSLLDALNAPDPVDATALQSFAARHSSGMFLLGTTSEHMPHPWEVPPKALEHLLRVASQTYRNVVVDLPRQIDPLTTTVLQNASRVLVVVQQSLAHVRDAKRMLRVMTADLGVPREHVLLVVNRHSERNPIHLHDIQEAVRPASWVAVPNDFIRVSEALDTGMPLYDSARTAPITRTLIDLATRLASGAAEAETSPHKRAGLRGALSEALGISRAES